MLQSLNFADYVPWFSKWLKVFWLNVKSKNQLFQQTLLMQKKKKNRIKSYLKKLVTGTFLRIQFYFIQLQ